jgi:4-hydroxybenzoate polyprenyltransferase
MSPHAPANAAGGLPSRLWQYQAERFPVFKHGALIAAFGASAVCLSALLRGATPQWPGVVVAIIVLFGFFFQLRVADEHKDNEEDEKFRPERPVPRGLVSLKELRGVAIAAAIIQIATTVLLDPMLILLLLAVWGWMALMTKEFFAPRWLKARPLVYMISHMAVMPLIDLYATACDWLPAASAVQGGTGHDGFALTLGAFLILSLVNGAVIELARKSWAPEQEREGVETYSKLWKPGPAGVAVMSLVLAGFAISAFINVRSSAGTGLLAALMLVSAGTAWCAIDYSGTPTLKTAKAMETASGLFVLGNYLLLGVLPLLVSLWL